MGSTALLALLTAPCVGSFTGVVALRLREHRPWAWSRSACASCGRVLPASELIPLLSFALLRGRCSGCGNPIGWLHPAVELAALLVALLAVASGATGALLWAGCLLGWWCLALALTDLACLRLPDAMTLPLLLAGLLVTAWLQPDVLFEHALACLAGWAVLRGLALVYRRVRGVEGMGAGDAKLLAAIGAWLGLAALPRVLLLAATATLLGVLLEAAWTRRPLSVTRRVPFGPGLAAALFAGWLLAF